MSRLPLLLVSCLLAVGCAATDPPVTGSDGASEPNEPADSSEVSNEDPSTPQVQIDDDQVKPARDAVTGFNTGKRLYMPTN